MYLCAGTEIDNALCRNQSKKEVSLARDYSKPLTALGSKKMRSWLRMPMVESGGV